MHSSPSAPVYKLFCMPVALRQKQMCRPKGITWILTCFLGITTSTTTSASAVLADTGLRALFLCPCR